MIQNFKWRLNKNCIVIRPVMQKQDLLLSKICSEYFNEDRTISIKHYSNFWFTPINVCFVVVHTQCFWKCLESVLQNNCAILNFRLSILISLVVFEILTFFTESIGLLLSNNPCRTLIRIAIHTLLHWIYLTLDKTSTFFW